MKKTATIRTEAFASQHTLERIDLRYNRISSIEGGAFSGLTSPKEIYLAGNRLVQLNSDVFEVQSDTFPNEKQRFLQIFFFSIYNFCRVLLRLRSWIYRRISSQHFQRLHCKKLAILSC